jgi:hypothetical protein|tara:strand:- start:1751 stop:2098 length:348 start_codon:yes stop_codon:yes gene_type:complete
MIKNKTLLVNVEHDITVGNNDAIEATLIHQIVAHTEDTDYTRFDNVEVEVEFIDVVDVKFLGRKIEEGYQEYQKFKEQMLDLGINVDELIDNAGVGIVTTEEIDEVKQMFFRALK